MRRVQPAAAAMAERRVAAVLDAEGVAAPPRRNGELVFAAPWESRLFGLTMSLHRAGLFEWEEFRQRLIAAIGRWESAGPAAGPWSYYRCWQAAFEDLLTAKGLCAVADLAARCDRLAARSAGHDH
jgi:nitrile hydratase accessory protein